MHTGGWVPKRAGRPLLSTLASGWLVASATPVLAADDIVSADKIDPCLPSAINLSVNSGVVGASTLSDLLSEHRRGGPELSAKIRKLALSDASKIRDILIAEKTATPDQVTAIGAGLADVIRRCGDMLPELAAHIGEEVAGAKSPGLSIAFVAHLPPENLIEKWNAPALPEKKVKGELPMTVPPPPLPEEPRKFMADPESEPKPGTAEIVARTKEVPVASEAPGPKFHPGKITLGKPGLRFSAGGGGGQTEISNNTVSPTK